MEEDEPTVLTNATMRYVLATLLKHCGIDAKSKIVKRFVQP